MIRKYLIIPAVTLLTVISFTGFATAKSAPKEEVVYVANFNYTPASQAAPGSSGVTFAIGDTTLGYKADSKILWTKAPQFANLHDAIKQDLFKLFTAKGFTVRGPFDSYDLVPYQDKKTIDLYLTPIFEVIINTPDELYTVKGLKLEVVAIMKLELRETVTRELMWFKSIPFTKFDFPWLDGTITWRDPLSKASAENDKLLKTIGKMELHIGGMNNLAKRIEEQFPAGMDIISKLIDPEEMRIIKKQCQELKSKKGY